MKKSGEFGFPKEIFRSWHGKLDLAGGRMRGALNRFSADDRKSKQRLGMIRKFDVVQAGWSQIADWQ
jgi:hypothetical protein